MQVLHVNLGLTTTGHTGAVADPMSWADVRAFLLAIPTTAAAVDLVFRCRGTGALLSTEQAVNLANLHFTDANVGIRFVADDPGLYGLPVISTPAFGAGVTALQPNQAWFKLTTPTSVRLDFQGFVFDINQPFGSDGYDLVEVSGGVGPVVNVSRNIFIERGVGHRFVHVHGTDTTAKAVTVGNTVCFGDVSSGAQEFARIETGRLFTGLNYSVQSPTSPAVVMFTTAIQELYTHANAFALRASSLLYTGATPNRYSNDVIGINALTQGVFNIDAIDAAQPAPALGNGLSYSEASGFWPVHGGYLFKLGSVAIPASLDLGMTALDAFGYSRPVTAQDAGAVQKSGRSEPSSVHVDLSTATTGGSGSETSPIGRAEFLVDYSRRAPVDYQLTYVMRGSNVASPIPEFDTGPLSPNAAAVNLTYTGAGTIKLTGYKTYNRRLPIFSAQNITPNAHMPVIMERMKLEFAGDTDFIAGTLLNTVAEMRIRACVIRSRAAAVGMFVRVDADNTRALARLHHHPGPQQRNQHRRLQSRRRRDRAPVCDQPAQPDRGRCRQRQCARLQHQHRCRGYRNLARCRRRRVHQAQRDQRLRGSGQRRLRRRGLPAHGRLRRHRRASGRCGHSRRRPGSRRGLPRHGPLRVPERIHRR